MRQAFSSTLNTLSENLLRSRSTLNTISRNLLKEVRSNPLGIDWSPAPSPEDGPPASANAIRDKKYLPGQICGIIGAYLICLAIVGIALHLARKRRYRHTKVDIELVQPHFPARAFYPSPASASTLKQPKNFSWPVPEKTQNPYIFPSPTREPISATSTVADPFDPRVLESDRDHMQRDLEDIYAHVMEQEEAKAAGVILKSAPVPLRMQSQAQAQAPIPAEAPQRTKKPTFGIDISKAKSSVIKPGSRTSSILSSLKSPGRRKDKERSVRSLRISSPIPTPLSATFPHGAASDEEPLSPRYYSPPPPPPIPTDQVPFVSHSRKNSANESTAPTSPTRINTGGPPVSMHNNYQSHRPVPSLSTPSTSARSSHIPSSAISANSQTPFFPPSQNPANPSTAAAASSSTRTLPFRAYEPSIPSPATQQTKTTVLERTQGPLSPSGLKTPWSAGAVPYSPYQPFTPMMPVTPRLVTREDRKMMKKEEKNRMKNVGYAAGGEVELVKSQDELWDSGY